MAVDFMNQAMPYFPLMHEMTTEHVHEEIQLLANDFSSMLMETLGHVPAWRDYYLAHDQTPHYEHLRTSSRRCSTCAAAAAGCSSRRSTSSSCRCSRGVPRRGGRGHAPRPGAGDAVDAGDGRYTARMHRSPVPLREIATTGRPARPDAPR